MSTSEPEPPPHGILIEDAREAARLSKREAARRAGISDAWWRYLVRGYQKAPGDLSSPADTIARMAHAVGLTPERLESEGQRPDAAEILRGIIRSREQATPRQRPQLAEVPHPGMSDRLIEWFISQRPTIDDGGDREVLDVMWRQYRAGFQDRDFVIGKILDYVHDDPSLPADWDKPGGGEQQHALTGP